MVKGLRNDCWMSPNDGTYTEKQPIPCDIVWASDELLGTGTAMYPDFLIYMIIYIHGKIIDIYMQTCTYTLLYKVYLKFLLTILRSR